ncbi:MAG TPA: hypothetical protein VGG38_04065, partial [Acidimicrobiales bacterium]
MTTAGMAGTYVGLPAPVRISDTRAGSGQPNTGHTLSAGGTETVQVTGVGTGGIPAGATTAVLNVAVTNATASSFVTVYPAGATQPLVASLNFTAGETISNLVTVPVSATGAVTVFNNAGSADVVIDAEGYYTATPQSTGRYDAVNPDRVFGTTAGGTTVTAGSVTPVTVTGGSTGVPTSATAVVVNVTASAETSAGFLTIYPAGATQPTAANLNFSAGQVIGNRVNATVGSNGQIDIYNFAGSTGLDVDLDGYYTGTAGSAGSTFTPITPVRLTDTRSANNGSPISANSSEAFSFAAAGIPANSSAVASNVTVVAGATAGFITVYPTTDSSVPLAADVNFPANGINQNFADAPLNGDTTEIYNFAGTVNVVIDAFGYFTPASVTVVASPASIPASGTGSTSAVTVTVANSSGLPVNGDALSFTLTPSVTGACGTLSGGSSTTNSSGQVNRTYHASTTAGICTISVIEADNAQTGSTTITQTGVNNVALSPTSASIVGNGTSTDVLTATVTSPAAGN